MKRPLVVTPGEPAGVGPDLLLRVAQAGLKHPLVAITDKHLLIERANLLGLSPDIPDYTGAPTAFSVIHQPLCEPCIPGQLNPANAPAVLHALETAIIGCTSGQFSALVTGPVHKATLQRAYPGFTGHTGYLAQYTKSQTVMMFTLKHQRLALLTTHIPLSQVPANITEDLLFSTIPLIHRALKTFFKLKSPKLLITGLNPHAGEQGTLGTEEITLIAPTIKKLRQQGIDLEGPISADTALHVYHEKKADVVISLYHDQLLPAFKSLGFGKLVNLTLGLPFVRTSVDHGTALNLAGTNQADASSFIQACKLALSLSTPP